VPVPPAVRRSDESAERRRLAEADDGSAPWREWGPYLAERAWGTVREDYSADGDAWQYFPHDHARSRVFRWNEDGLGGICDDRQTWCLGFAFWNGRDPILKERAFGLTNTEGNHGEDVKDHWWYLDSTPTHSWMRWRYHYPQAAFPYDDLVAENARRGRDQPEYELVDTGVFTDNRYWAITADYAKASPHDVCIRLTVENRGPVADVLHVLPTLWFRNTWAWGVGPATEPVIRADGTRLVAEHETLGTLVLAGDGTPRPLCCDNETNTERLCGSPGRSPYPKDALNDHVVRGLPAVNPVGVGTKAALHYTLAVPAGGTATVRLRLTRGVKTPSVAVDWARVMTLREREADAWHASLLPQGIDAEGARIARQAVAGVLWSKTFYHYDVDRWVRGDPAQPPPPPSRAAGRNATWRHVWAHDVVALPDPWEYPWHAAWDLAFHTVTLAHVDPTYAKEQLLLLCREWYLHPNGQLPAYEWDFSDVNPPVHAWAARRVFELDGSSDFHFLERVFHKLLLNFTWWVNREDADGNNVFSGGFLGLDNIGPFDRSTMPVGGHLEQSDGSAWMAVFCLEMLEIALALALHDETYEDIATKFFEHFAYIAGAIDQQGLWDEDAGFFHDVLHAGDGRKVPLRYRSAVGLVPLYAVATLPDAVLARYPAFVARSEWFLRYRADLWPGLERAGVSEHGERLLALVDAGRLERILTKVFDEAEFLSAHGVRSLSAAHRDAPYTFSIDGVTAQVDYEPAESRSGMFGGNSNWRGPIWLPLNYLLVVALRRFARHHAHLTVELPTGSGQRVTLDQAADELTRRVVGLFRAGPDGRRPVFGGYHLFQTDPAWHELLPFHEYFHGDTGAGLGASHQTGWTALVANLLLER
jgi:hypothetical protein